MASPPSSPLPQREDDLYRTLNVSRDAAASDLKRSFRRLSQLYHPDKHQEETAKSTATDRFTTVKEAYEILSDDKLRKLYDEFGLHAARVAASHEMELVPYSDLAERFRNDSAPGGPSAGSNSPRDAYFTVTNSFEPTIDATGLIVALEDAEPLTASGLPVFSQVGVSTMATAYVSQKNTVQASYSAQSSTFGKGGRRGGAGELALSFRRQLDAYMNAEATAYVPLERGRTVNFGFKAFRALSQHMTASFEASYDPERRGLTTALTSARSFDERCTASTSWAFGAAPGYVFTWKRDAYDEYMPESKPNAAKEADDFGANDDEEAGAAGRIAWVFEKLTYLIDPMGWRWTGRLSALEASLGFVIRRPIGQNAPLWDKCEPTGPGGASVKVRGHVGAMGWEVEVGGGEKYVLSDTAWGTSVAFGNMGVVWRLKITRSGHRFTLPIVLVSSVCDARTATAAAIVTSLGVSAVQILIIEPWHKQRENEEREDAKMRRADTLKHGKSEAAAALTLMKEGIERSRKREEEVEIDGNSGGGLLIERAAYGDAKAVQEMRFSSDSVDGREIEMEIADVTDCVQMLVEDSAVQVVSGTKSTLMGFWDPSAYGEKEDLVLRIWYRFRGELHECVVRDDEAIELPLSSHRVDRWS